MTDSNNDLASLSTAAVASVASLAALTSPHSLSNQWMDIDSSTSNQQHSATSYSKSNPTVLISYNSAALESKLTLLAQTTELKFAAMQAELASLSAKIAQSFENRQFEDISYSYDDRTSIIDALSASTESGQFADNELAEIARRFVSDVETELEVRIAGLNALVALSEPSHAKDIIDGLRSDDVLQGVAARLKRDYRL